RARRRETLVDEARKHVVDALARNVREAGRLCGGRRVAPQEREIRLGLVAGQSEATELGGGRHTGNTIYHHFWCHASAGRGSAARRGPFGPRVSAHESGRRAQPLLGRLGNACRTRVPGGRAQARGQLACNLDVDTTHAGETTTPLHEVSTPRRRVP